MSHDEPQGLGAFSGVLRHRDAAQGRSAFSGKGRTLGESGKLGKEKERGVAHAQEEKKDKVGSVNSLSLYIYIYGTLTPSHKSGKK